MKLKLDHPKSSEKCYSLSEFILTANRIMILPEEVPISYSDGDASENYIIETLKGAQDRSTASIELQRKITDWPSEYHFSSERANLLRHLQFKKGDNVLELGCGCGAITRFLGEAGCQVTAIEGSQRRAIATRLRCDDLQNVTVYSANFSHINFDEAFDWILLVGVLEYAALYSSNDEPYLSMLSDAFQLLKPNGKLIVAIENRLGLKYFGGCTEDHLASHFSGIEDRYGPKTAATFGRHELKNLIEKAGFSNLEFQYPFPDYKLPSVIITEAGTTCARFKAYEMIRHLPHRDYGGKKKALFNEALVWQQLWKNNLIRDLSNSFLVIASKTDDRIFSDDLLAYTYAAKRHPGFTTSTSFRIVGNEILVEKTPIFSTPAAPKNSPFSQQLGSASYIDAQLLHSNIIESIARRDLIGLREAFSLWGKAIASKVKDCQISVAGSILISGNLFDLQPKNILTDGKSFHLIDEEWQFERYIPITLPIIRYFRHHFNLQKLCSDAGIPNQEQYLLPLLLPEPMLHITEADAAAEEIFLDLLEGYVIPQNTKNRVDESAILHKSYDIANKMLQDNKIDAAINFMINAAAILNSSRLSWYAAVVAIKCKLNESDIKSICWFASTLTNKMCNNESLCENNAVIYHNTNTNLSPRLIAFHLPQFHTIPENDQWWGKGFTEWTNVSKAIPCFSGHYQPHVPAELGYYDLSNSEALKAQAGLAREYGIHAFCFYHYWFNGKLLLEKPLHQMLKSGEPNFPFCMCWANEDWTKAWDGRSGEILIGQNYSDHDDIRHFDYLFKFFKDKRYVRVNGKPLFLIYRANRLPDPEKTAKTWRELAEKQGIGELYLCRVESFPDEHTDPKKLGFDASIEFQPDWQALGNNLAGEDYGDHAVYDYNAVVQRMLGKSKPSYTRFPCVTPAWDNSPRRKSNATIFINSSPAIYQLWLKESIRKVRANTSEERIVFINAWNEWGEGNHLEPDMKYGRKYLEATRSALGLTDNEEMQVHEKNILNSYEYKVSIIIPVFNKVDYTRNCTRAITETTDGILYEVVIIDNGSTDGTRDYLRCLNGDVKIITNDRNVGYTIACNQGARVATGQYILFLNNDTEPQPGWLDALIETMDGDSYVGVAGSKLIYPDGRLQEAGGIIFSDGSGWNYGRFDNPDKPEYNYIREVDYVSGACLMIRRSLLETLGYFDEQYSPGYYEDTDLCFAVRAAGYKVIYTPFSTLIHHEGITSGTDLSKGMKQFQVVNHSKFIKKWGETLQQQKPAAKDNVVCASERNVVGNILVIDPILPAFDKASGSLRLFMIVSLFKKLGYHLTYIAREGRGQERYIEILRKMGVEVYASDPDILRQMGVQIDAPVINLKEMLSARRFDFAYLSFYEIAIQYMAKIRLFSPSTKIIIDTVDIHFVREKRQAELAHDREALARAKTTELRELSIYSKADLIITLTEQDWSSVSESLPGKRFFVIPNIHTVHDVAVDIKGRSGIVFVGNFNHSPNIDSVIYFVNQIFPIVRKALPSVTFTVVGNNPPKEILGLNGKNIIVTGYVPSTEPYLENARVSVAPLRFGAGMKGKIGEAMALGLPVVTTSIGAEGMGLVHGETAFISDNPKEFARYIVRLYTDDKLWGSVSDRGRQYIKEHFTPEKVLPQIDRMINVLENISAIELTDEEKTSMALTCRNSWKDLVSIIILTFNELEHTIRCIESIKIYTPGPHEIIFVDNASTDGTLNYLKKLLQENPNYKLIENKKNLGFAAGNNQGLTMANGRYLLMLNNDTIVTEGWLARMLSVFERYPEVGIVGPVSNYVSGPQQVKEASYRNIYEMHHFAKQWSSEHYEQSMELFRIVGFCLLAKCEVIDRIGGLDEQFGVGNFEDDDFCLRAAASGYTARIALDVFIHHTGSQTFKGAGINYQKTAEHNWQIFKKKWDLPPDLPYGSNYTIYPYNKDLSKCYIPLKSQTDVIQSAAVTESSSLVHPEFVEKMISIIVPVKSINLNKCLQSLRKYTNEPHEIIFLEHDTSPKLKKQIVKLVKENHNYKIIKFHKDLNFIQSLNEGIKQSVGEYIVILFDDVIVYENWLADMLDCLHSEKKIGIVGAMSNNASDRQKVSSIDFNSKEDRLSFREKNRGVKSQTTILDGFCMLFRHDLFIRLSLFDETFGCDKHVFDDFCVRSAVKGFKNVIASNVLVYNQGGINTVMSADSALFFEKWGDLDKLTQLQPKETHFKNMDDDMFRKMHVLLCYPGSRDSWNLPVISEIEIFCGPDCRASSEMNDLVEIQTNTGLYDISMILRKIPKNLCPELVVVRPSIRNKPFNTYALNCPKVAIIGKDFIDPLQLDNLVEYLHNELFDYILIDTFEVPIKVVDPDSNTPPISLVSAIRRLNAEEDANSNSGIPQFISVELKLFSALSNFILIGERLYSAGKTMEAMKCFTHTIEYSNDNDLRCQAFNNIGVIAHCINDMNRAERMFLSALEIDPLNFHAQLNLSDVYIIQRRYDNALKVLKKANKIYPANEQFSERLALVSPEVYDEPSINIREDQNCTLFPMPLETASIYRENLKLSNVTPFIVCAMFTDSSNYVNCADRLAASCEDFRLPYSIYCVPEIHRSMSLNGGDNLSFTKANFICNCLDRFVDKPVVYLDIDMVVVDEPELLINHAIAGADLSIYNWLSDPHNEAYMPINGRLDPDDDRSKLYAYSHHIAYYSTEQLLCSGATQLWGNTSSARKLLSDWQNTIIENLMQADDPCLDIAYNNFDVPIKAVWIPKEYIRIPWWPHIKPVILHHDIPAPCGERPTTKIGDRKRLYADKLKIKTCELIFPKGYVIDTKNQLLREIDNNSIVDTKTIPIDMKFWIHM